MAAVRVLGDQVNAQYPPGGWRVGNQTREPSWGATAVALDDERIDPLVRRSVLIMLAAVALPDGVSGASSSSAKSPFRSCFSVRVA